MNYFTHALLVTASLLMASTASAATYTFDLQNTNLDNPDRGDDGVLVDNSLTIIQGDLTGSFTGYYIDGAEYTGDELTGGTVNAASSVEREDPCRGVQVRHA